MKFFGSQKQTLNIRTITQADALPILRLVDSAWRVSLRLTPREFRTRLKTMTGFLAEDKVGLRGFLVIEPRPPDLAFLVAAGLRDTWSVKLFLDSLLPQIEYAAQLSDLSRLIYIGSAVWLIEGLWLRQFQTREWIVVLQRSRTDLPSAPPAPATLRSADPDQLESLSKLDALTFDQIWQKSTNRLVEGLAMGDSIMLAEIEGLLVGYEWCESHPQHAHLNRLAVHPDYQGQGIGAQLLHRAITDALSKGVRKITLNTQEHNHRSIALYQRFGFEMTDQRMPVLVKTLD